MSVLAPEAVPRLKPGVRRRWDASRNAHILLAPERVVMLDDIAAAVLERVDGVSSIEAMAIGLAAAFDAPLETVRADVLELLGALRDKGMIAT